MTDGQLVENTIPVLGVRDLDVSIGFYTEILGFALAWNSGKTCAVSRDDCHIMLSVEAAAGAWAWIGLENESLMETCRVAEVTVIQEPTNQPWAYEMKILDPDGNVLWLGAEPRDEVNHD